MTDRPDYLHSITPDGAIEIAPLESRLAQMLEETGRDRAALISYIRDRAGSGYPKGMVVNLSVILENRRPQAED